MSLSLALERISVFYMYVIFILNLLTGNPPPPPSPIHTSHDFPNSRSISGIVYIRSKKWFNFGNKDLF